MAMPGGGSMLGGAVREVFGLFVDDAALALAIVVWLLVAGVALPHLGLPAALPPVALFVGLATILAVSAVRRGRASGRR